ncbi:cerebellin 13 [Myxocyprinus asiaticus]|uniref:cerebellin 13 n=1 Tax=Myxocyprinus asiaticus TaxID=70543 RepID=UPI0022221B46|nr:cerebellin 13 [Myxocyprinus asiaticus]
MLALKMVLLVCVGASLAQELITAEKLKSIEERLRITEATLNELKRENEALRMTAQASEIKLESLQAVNKAKEVAFSVGLLSAGSQQFGPFSTQENLVYKKIFINTGNAYDSSTGIFTAPVNGVYFFRFYVHSHPDKQMAVSLYKNSERQCSIFSLKPQTNTNASNGVILTLKKGDKVNTQLWENSWLYDDENNYTSFSGFLLFPS